MRRLKYLGWIILLILAACNSQEVALTPPDYSGTPQEICQKAVPEATQNHSTFDAPQPVLQEGRDYRAILCTAYGAVYVDLFEDAVPDVVNNFAFLALSNFYNGTVFYRAIPNYRVEGGSPDGTPQGSPGYNLPLHIAGFLAFDRPGQLGMISTNPNDPLGEGSSGSRFFITTNAAPQINYTRTLFGEVLDGLEAVEQIKRGDILQAVVLIDDPARVVFDETPTPLPTMEDVAAALSAESLSATLERFGYIPPTVPPLTIVEKLSGVFDTAEVLATAPENAQNDYSAFLERYGHQYRVSAALKNQTCDLSGVTFMELRYSLDAFASREQATAALMDGFLADLAQARGFTITEAQDTTNLSQPVYIQSTRACNKNAVHGITYWQRGRFIVTAEVISQTGSGNNIQTPAFWLRGIVQFVFENALSDVLRAELR